MDPQNIDHIISTLPTENGWLSDDNYPLYYYQGFWYHGFTLRGAVASQAGGISGFDPSPTDIILSSNPKCGTTWLKALCFAITTRTRHFTQDEHPLHLTNPHDLILLLEAAAASGLQTRDPDLPLISTHLPYSNLPGSILTSGCKIVYIWRDPKDTLISHWHYHRKIRSNKEVTKPIPLEEAFDLFCRGVSAYGPYWDHILGYWKACLDRPDKILFLKYEDMLDDAQVQVKRLAEFMGFPFSEEEEKGGVVARIVEMSSFESLSNLAVNKGGEFRSKGTVSLTKDAFFRNGKAGDWKNYLTEDMVNTIDQITTDKLGASGLTL